jgi:hypothetical protein
MSPRRVLLLLIGVLVLPSCSGWHPTRVAPEIAPVIDASRPVRATPQNGRPVVLWHPRVVGDSLIGEVGHPPLRTAIALRDLRRLDEFRYSRVRTGVAVVTGLGVGFVLFAVLGAIGSGS